MADIPVAEAVAAGVELLDRERPGWAAHIDLDRFDIGCCDDCTLGQLWGDYDLGRTALGILAYSAERLGFNPELQDEPATQAEWVRIITERRGQAVTT
jgi:hypothetical protein